MKLAPTAPTASLLPAVEAETPTPQGGADAAAFASLLAGLRSILTGEAAPPPDSGGQADTADRQEQAEPTVSAGAFGAAGAISGTALPIQTEGSTDQRASGRPAPSPPAHPMSGSIALDGATVRTVQTAPGQQPKLHSGVPPPGETQDAQAGAVSPQPQPASPAQATSTESPSLVADETLPAIHDGEAASPLLDVPTRDTPGNTGPALNTSEAAPEVPTGRLEPDTGVASEARLTSEPDVETKVALEPDGNLESEADLEPKTDLEPDTGLETEADLETEAGGTGPGFTDQDTHQGAGSKGNRTAPEKPVDEARQKTPTEPSSGTEPVEHFIDLELSDGVTQDLSLQDVILQEAVTQGDELLLVDQAEEARSIGERAGTVDPARPNQPGFTRQTAAAWVHSVLNRHAHAISLHDGWQIMEMNLDENQGSVTVKAKRDAEGVSVSVGFSDARVGATVQANAARLEQILESQYEASVDLSFFERNGERSEKREQARFQETATGSAHTGPGSDTESSLPNRTRPRSLNGAREWVG